LCVVPGERAILKGASAPDRLSNKRFCANHLQLVPIANI
jgi:hypothetical protein